MSRRTDQMKIILLVILMFFACGIALVLLKRLLDTVQQLGALRGDLNRNSVSMREHMDALEQARQQQQNATSQQRDASRESSQDKNQDES